MSNNNPPINTGGGPSQPGPGLFSGARAQGAGPNPVPLVQPVPRMGGISSGPQIFSGSGPGHRIHSAPIGGRSQFSKTHSGMTIEEAAPDHYVLKYDLAGNLQTHGFTISDKSNDGIKKALGNVLEEANIPDNGTRGAAIEAFYSAIRTKGLTHSPDGCNDIVSYNSNDVEETRNFQRKLAECNEKKNREKEKQRAAIRSQSFQESQTQMQRVKEVGTAGSLIAGIAEYFSSATTFGNSDRTTWIILIIYIVVLIIFPLMMWGIMTRELKKYKAYKSVFFGLYLASFVLVVIGMFFIKSRTNHNGYISEYGSFLALIVFGVMSLIMGWKGIYMMLKDKDD